MKLKLIVAICQNMGIGYKNKLPWNIKKDLTYFSNKTKGKYGKYLKNINQYDSDSDEVKNIKKNAIIMGKNTWLSLPNHPNPLPYRDNIIISTSMDKISCKKKPLNMNEPDVKPFMDFYFKTFFDELDFTDSINCIDLNLYFSTISGVVDFFVITKENWENTTESEDKTVECEMCEINQNSAVKKIDKPNGDKYKMNENNSDEYRYDEVWIIGGEKIYKSFIKENMDKNGILVISEFCITYIDKYYECDTFFPKIENMNLYYISSFSKQENIDSNSGLTVPVYYIIFTIIDKKDDGDIKKVLVQYKGETYYYYVQTNRNCDTNSDAKCDANSDTNSDANSEYITSENAGSFLWCIFKDDTK